MTFPVSVVTSQVITPEEVRAVFRDDANATLLDEPVYLVRVSRDSQHVWIGLSTTELDDMDNAQREKMRHVLGAEPRSVIGCDISWENDADRLGVQVVSRLLARWPGVVIDGDNRIYTAEQIEAMRAANQGFWDTPSRSTGGEE